MYVIMYVPSQDIKTWTDTTPVVVFFFMVFLLYMTVFIAIVLTNIIMQFW